MTVGRNAGERYLLRAESVLDAGHGGGRELLLLLKEQLEIAAAFFGRVDRAANGFSLRISHGTQCDEQVVELKHREAGRYADRIRVLINSPSFARAGEHYVVL